MKRRSQPKQKKKSGTYAKKLAYLRGKRWPSDSSGGGRRVFGFECLVKPWKGASQ